ncbi:cation transporter dimerization domain-containing protein [Sporomusa sphaeroides]|uniref:cation transporter dimerization domain-containing protein n=1 Tax=Sporomusa sphaeroides TaxID=47679 RepID=UPI003A5216BE
MHLILDKHMPLDKAHTICDQIEATIKHRFGICDVMIHLEPDEGKASSYIPNSEINNMFCHAVAESKSFFQK